MMDIETSERTIMKYEIKKLREYEKPLKVKGGSDGTEDLKYFDFSELDLKPDHEKRPLWILPDRRIFLETFSSLYECAYEFLIAIAEPKSRPAFIHEYKITQYSLYAAMVLQLTADKIKELLFKLCKNKRIPDLICEFIDQNTKKYGTAKLFLNQKLIGSNSYGIEIFDDQVLEDLHRKKSDVKDKLKFHSKGRKGNLDNRDSYDMSKRIQDSIAKNLESLIDVDENNITNTSTEESKIYEITIKEHTEVTKAFIENNIPIIEEYNFKNDNDNPNLEINLKQSTKIRQYQEKALSRIISGGKARSGVVVLPCGAGKTLVGILVCCAIQKRTIIICNTSLAIPQWKNQLKMFTDIGEEYIIRLSSKYYDYDKFKKLYDDKKPMIVITTYTMVSKSKKKQPAANEKRVAPMTDKKKILDFMKELEWGLFILDEVQVVPAKHFQKVLLEMKSHCKLGLTATLIREDEKIEDLNYMIGPKLYEENWLDLVNQGFLAKPYCVEIRCEMSKEFLTKHNETKERELKNKLWVGNPNKFIILQYLIQKHEERGDKIIVFSDKPSILEKYAQMLKIAVAHGNVSTEERQVILDYFRKNKINTIFLSSIGDTAIDLPSANVVIQLSSFFGSRKQEAQRLGRIMRPKENECGQYNAFFYTLVSLNTSETVHAAKRQRFLIDQGFSFEIVTDFPELKDEEIRRKIKIQLTDANSQREHLEWLLSLTKKEKEKFLAGKPNKSKDDDEFSSSSSDDEDISYAKNNFFNYQNTIYMEDSKKL